LAGIALTLHIGIQDASQDLALPWVVAASSSDAAQLTGPVNANADRDSLLRFVISHEIPTEIQRAPGMPRQAASTHTEASTAV
jgi:hypothetical protein